ncbi:hypothetical protein NUW54_g2013 [Trametes sanguinea]|uniref:Uncharacterized protein n=1 Tax=Trametes sanguinea TaxID=158606 RepID=A0ACC1Q618_9APHY|nr:hypothetical protein NUW54_g2013 [Trametes sanguinea]
MASRSPYLVRVSAEDPQPKETASFVSIPTHTSSHEPPLEPMTAHAADWQARTSAPGGRGYENIARRKESGDHVDLRVRIDDVPGRAVHQNDICTSIGCRGTPDIPFKVTHAARAPALVRRLGSVGSGKWCLLDGLLKYPAAVVFCREIQSDRTPLAQGERCISDNIEGSKVMIA